MTAHQIIIALIFVFCIPSQIFAMPSPAAKKTKPLSIVEDQHEQIQRLLDDNEVLVQYSGLNKLSATVISKKAYSIIKFDSELATLKQEVENFYVNCINRKKSATNNFFKLKDKKAQSNFYKNVSIIYHLLFVQKGKVSDSNKEVNIKQLIGNKDIILIPLSNLKRFPLELLITDTIQKQAYGEYDYLVKSHNITYYPTQKDFIRLRRSQTHDNTSPHVLLLGNPIDTLGEISRLPYSEKEIQEIAKLYDSTNVTLFLGETATKQNFLQALEQEKYKFIHLATHTKMYQEDTCKSVIMFSGNTSNPKDGQLSLCEISTTNYLANLIILSSCETGVGWKGTGFPTKFLKAATSSTIASLWKVQDNSTKKFFIAFHKKYHKKEQTKYNSFRETQLEMIKEGLTPYEWGPFVFFGEKKK